MAQILVGKAKRQVRSLAYSVFMCAFALFWFLPIIWMFSTSFKPNPVAATYPIRWIPNPWTWENYVTVVKVGRGVDIPKAFSNSVIVSTLVALGVLFTATPAAYIFARVPFRGRDVIFWAIVATLALPVQMFYVPVYIIVDRMGLLDTLPALILPPISPALGVFLLRQFMLSIPGELEDAARIDGCSRLRFLVSIAVPLVKPALVSLGLITFLSSWNNLMWPLLVIRTPSRMTLPLALARFQGTYHLVFEAGTIMAGVTFAIVPVIALFAFLHTWIIRGVSLSIEK